MLNNFDSMEQAFENEVLTREFQAWYEDLEDEATLGWVNTLIDSIEVTVNEFETFKKNLMYKYVIAGQFIFIILLGICFIATHFDL